MEITTNPNKENKALYDVYIDGEFSFTITNEDYFNFNIYQKTQITKEELDIIKQNTVFKLSKSSAIKYLALNKRTQFQIRNKLLQKGFDNSVIEKTIKYLETEGYIDDYTYAKSFVYDRLKLNPKSRMMLSKELSEKGISSQIITNVLKEFKFNEQDIIKNMIIKKYKKINLSNANQINKIKGFFMRRGFCLDDIEKVLKVFYEDQSY